MDLEATLERFFREVAPLTSGDSILVAFSGGSDSTALLLALREFARGRSLTIRAAHIDHGLDHDSRARAGIASRRASELGVACTVRRCAVPDERRRGESLEVAARRVRYRELERIRRAVDARYIATAHHLDDQAETVVLRVANGHDLAALSGIPERRERIIRPLLRATRRQLTRFVRGHGCEWIEDPANTDCRVPRNRVRHRVLPVLERDERDLSARLAGLTRTVRSANSRLSSILESRLAPEADGRYTEVSRAALKGCGEGLIGWAVAHLLRRAGADRRPSRRALAHLERLLLSDRPIAVDLGGRWRAESDARGTVRFLETPREIQPFAYNLEVPGEVHLVELSSSFRLTAGRSQPWMFRGAPRQAGLSLPSEANGLLTVRNRRPGDRVQPLGSSFRRKLKDLLIDNRIPRYDRDRLPLLCHSDRILWVPGVTIDHEARIQEHSKVWVAEIIPDE
ncbi:MAG: tRNA lysidine(34) synthetase TilS [Thermoanaerobaculia bacterium]